MSEIIELNFFEEEEEVKEELEILENRKEKKQGKITYERVKGKDGQYIKGLRVKLVDNKKYGYESTFCIGYKDVHDLKKGAIVHKQIKERKSFTNKDKAIAWLNEMADKKSKLAEKGKIIEKHGYTLEEVCDLYKDYTIKHGATRGQIQDLNNRINHYKKFFVSDNNKYVKIIDTKQIQDYLDFEKKQGRCKKSIDKYKSTLKQIWDFMLQDRNKYQVESNIVIPSRNWARESGFESVALRYDELEELILEFCQLEDPTYLFLCVFAYTQALRRGELCGLQWGDVNWDTKSIIIEHNRVQRVKSNEEGEEDTDENNVKLPKRDKKRYIELHRLGYDTLKLYKDWQEKYLGRKVRDNEFVLMYEINLKFGYLPHSGKVSRKWKEEYNKINKDRIKMKKEPIRYARLHDGRETYSTLLLHGVMKKDGTIIDYANPRQVYESMGHELPEFMQNTTETVYSKNTGNRWDITRFWDNLLDVDVIIEWNTYDQIRAVDLSCMSVVERERLKVRKEKRFEKAYKEKNAGNPPEEIFIEYE